MKGGEPVIVVGNEDVPIYHLEAPTPQAYYEPLYVFNFWEFPIRGGNAQMKKKAMKDYNYKQNERIELKYIEIKNLDVNIYYVVQSVYK